MPPFRSPWNISTSIVRSRKRCAPSRAVLGGPGFAILPEPYVRALDGDWGVAGEGEQAFVELLTALDHGWNPAGIPGVISGRRTTVDAPVSITPRRRRPDWAAGLRPARDLFDYPRYIRRGGMGNVQTKRGCVFKCNYCTHPLLEGNRFRARDAGDVVDELEALMADYGPHRAARRSRHARIAADSAGG
jgi:radical SAM superfamily enzyme YgiQ (UPF0313 family)